MDLFLLTQRYYIFRAWGRIGTTIGGHQTDPHLSKQDAIDFFEEKYEEKTGNRFGSKFVKKPGKYISLDLDYGQSQVLLLVFLRFIEANFILLMLIETIHDCLS